MKRLAMIVLLGAGCSGLSMQEFCDSRAEALCVGRKACGGAAAGVSCDVIHNNLRPAWPACDSLLWGAVDAGVTKYVASRAEECVAQSRSTCGPVAVCDGVFIGTLDAGAACHTSAECTPTTWCDDRATCPGVCQPRLGDGQTAPTLEACATTSFDLLEDGGVGCRNLRQRGEKCEPHECLPGLVCTSGQCNTAPKPNEACVQGQCGASELCRGGVCLTWRQKGEPCAPQLPEADGGLCQLGLACRDGTCGEALGEGESCAHEPNRCGAGLKCKLDSLLCVRVAGDGGVCSSIFDCERELTCTDGQCAAPRGDGEACPNTQGCQRGLLCVAGRCTLPVCSP